MIRMPTGHTLKSTLCLSVLLAGMSTLVTPLTGILWVYKDYVTKLVIAVGIEPAPSSILNHAVQSCFGFYILARIFNRTLGGLGHILDLQVFTLQSVSFRRQLTAVLMCRIDSAVLLFPLPLVDLPFGSLVPSRSFLLTS